MNCARCGNPLHRLPMFDLPRKVKEFSCLCCGERFWTTQGEARLVTTDPERPHPPGRQPHLSLSLDHGPHRN